MTLTPEKLDEIERLAECAEQDVPGPWEVDENGFDIEVVNTTDSRLEDGAYFCVCESDYNAIADYIVSLDPATVRELVRAAKERDAQAARIAEREKPCVWTPEGDDSSSWNTGCGSSFWFDDGHEGVNFCPFCGHPAVFDHEGDEA